MSPERPDWLCWEIGAEGALWNERRAIQEINGQRGMDLMVATETASKHRLVQETEKREWGGVALIVSRRHSKRRFPL